MTRINIPKKPERKFVDEDLIIDSWKKIEKFYENLMHREISTLQELKKWMNDRSELESVLEEDMAWRYIKMNIDTTNKNLAEKFNFWINSISPKVSPYNQKLNLKLLENPLINELDPDKYKIYIRGVKKSIEIYREDNIPLFTEMKKKEQEYGAICAKMIISHKGKNLTMQQASALLKENDRKVREKIYLKISNRRKKDEKALDKLFDDLINLRKRIANNAGFNNYRDYMFAAMGRFDYTATDCYQFHDSIQHYIVPTINNFEQERKVRLKINNYKPWDTEVDIAGKKPLKPFNGSNELIDKTIQCFNKVRPFFGECIEIMNEMKHLDLESKEGKAPGGFMYPLYEIGVPFIYMNAVGSQRDLVTMVHEGGHAIHSFLSRDLEIADFKSTPSEVAELASMSMELISMKHWNVFYKNKEELKRAKLEQLKRSLETLPWVAAIDKFQHWIYTNDHNSQERREKWNEIHNEFGSNVIDWDGQEKLREILWQKQLHLYEVPFYYIEYGMAQLGAIAIWREFILHGDKAIEKYISALKLGYTKSISEIYETAGISFDFSSSYVQELSEFISAELNKIEN
tara:strand:- start:8517 stop:10238 length:1722 start_codon:yes stop_codon:yes gene_type:complete